MPPSRESPFLPLLALVERDRFPFFPLPGWNTFPPPPTIESGRAFSFSLSFPNLFPWMSSRFQFFSFKPFLYAPFPSSLKAKMSFSVGRGTSPVFLPLRTLAFRLPRQFIFNSPSGHESPVSHQGHPVTFSFSVCEFSSLTGYLHSSCERFQISLFPFFVREMGPSSKDFLLLPPSGLQKNSKREDTSSFFISGLDAVPLDSCPFRPFSMEIPFSLSSSRCSSLSRFFHLSPKDRLLSLLDRSWSRVFLPGYFPFFHRGFSPWRISVSLTSRRKQSLSLVVGVGAFIPSSLEMKQVPFPRQPYHTFFYGFPPFFPTPN